MPVIRIRIELQEQSSIKLTSLKETSPSSQLHSSVSAKTSMHQQSNQSGAYLLTLELSRYEGDTQLEVLYILVNDAFIP